MLERLRYFDKTKHKKSGKDFTTAQKLTLFLGSQMRSIKCAQSHLSRIAHDNPTVTDEVREAIKAIGVVRAALEAEYQRDRAALSQHSLEDLPK